MTSKSRRGCAPPARALLAAAAVAAAAAGCTTYLAEEREGAVRQREDVLLLQEDIRKLAGRLEGIEMETGRLRAEMDGLQRRMETDRSSANRGLQAQVDDLQQRLRQMDAARQNDREEMVESLSRKMAEIMQRSYAGGGSSRSGGPSAARTGSGYEHTVKSGETLSAIAQAYGIRVKAIQDANQLKSADVVRVGQVLFIPDAKP